METDKTINITVSGLGGQGVLTVTDILAEVFFLHGFDIKKSEVHGMSQRGGSVSSEVRVGKEVGSPMIPEGESDFLVILEASQVEVNLQKLKKGGVLITPDDIPLDRLTNPKAVNMMMLGALAKRFPEIAKADWIESMKRALPAKLHELNVQMFETGYNA